MAAGHKTGGRQKGTPNKTTQAVRDAIAVFAEGNVGRLQEWLDRIAEDDPSKAADLFVKLLEYHVPKLSRSDSSIALDANLGIREIVKEYVDDGDSE